MGHIVCEKSAGAVIKTYSPDLIVHTVLEETEPHGNASAADIFARVEPLLDRLHVVVVGPGLGRDALMLDTVSRCISAVRQRNLPLVVDADGLWLVTQRPDIVHGYAKAVLTPNVVEFARLRERLGVEDASGDDGEARVLQAVSRALGGVHVVKKAGADLIAGAGSPVLECRVPGGLKRCGGQGDVLSGIMGTMLAWKEQYLQAQPEAELLQEPECTALACYAACAATRTASRLAFEQRGRATSAVDLLSHVGAAYKELFED